MNSEHLPIIATDSSQAQVAVAQPLEPQCAIAAEPADEGTAAYKVIHQLLRGRYAVAILIGVLVAIVLGAGGWLATKPLYRSEALIRMSYDVPRLSGSDEQRTMDVFQAFMQSQQALLTSHKVVAEALRDPIWAQQGYRISPREADGFVGSLKVEHKGEHLRVVYEADDPQFSALAVQSIVNAYTRQYKTMVQEASTDRTQAMETRRDQLRTKMEQLETALRTESIEFGSSNVERFYDAAVQRLTKVESALIDVRIASALAQGSGSKGARYSPQQIARFDPTMARYTAEREQLETQLEQLRLRGYGEGHNQVIQVKKSLDLVANRIRDHAMEFQGTQLSGSSPAMAATQTPGLVGRSADELKADEENLTKLSQDVKQQLLLLGGKKLQVEAIRADMEKVKTELAEVNQKLALLQVESGMSGRMSVMSSGEIPMLPFRDRRPHMAFIGAMGGFLLPGAAIAATVAARRRYRYSEDAAQHLNAEIPLLGILPQLPARLTDPDCAADAAQCVHQIRVMLQVRANAGRANVYLMTSACPGEGKTSLTAALGLSYAAAGARTLLVDADLIGQRLTRGYQMEQREGFREAIAGGGVGLYPTSVNNLSMMPAGVSDGRDACAVSSNVIRRLLKDLRKDFDVILIDSGPILGSLEALVIAGQVDGAILTISREQQKPLVDRAIRQLKSVGAKIAGMVFNKAQSWDFRRSVGVSSLRSISRNSESGLVKAGVTSTSGFGSLVDSVQTYLPGRN